MPRRSYPLPQGAGPFVRVPSMEMRAGPSPRVAPYEPYPGMNRQEREEYEEVQWRIARERRELEEEWERRGGEQRYLDRQRRSPYPGPGRY